MHAAVQHPNIPTINFPPIPRAHFVANKHAANAFPTNLNHHKPTPQLPVHPLPFPPHLINPFSQPINRPSSDPHLNHPIPSVSNPTTDAFNKHKDHHALSH